MANPKPLDFSDLGATAVPQQTSAGTVARSSAASPIDFSDLGAKPVGSGVAAGTQGDAHPESALSRFGHNFLSGLGVTSNEDAKNFFEHPINTLMNSLNAQGELAKKAKDAYDRGDYKGAVIHGLNYLVPFIGQQTDKAGEQLSQGDYAGGIGRTLGAAVPIVAGSPEVQTGASDVASAAASTGARAVRAAARGANTVLEKAPGSVGATAGAALGHATRIPGAAEVGGAAGYALGKEVLPKVRVPGEGFGLPNRVTGGPTIAPAYEAPVRGSIYDDIHAAVNSPARTLPGQIAPEVINPPRPSYMQPSEPIQPRPGLALPAAPQGAELADLPATGARSAAQTGEALANLPLKNPLYDSPAVPAAESPRPWGSRGPAFQLKADLQKQLENSLGASPPPSPNVPLRQQTSAPGAAGKAIPAGHAAVDSSALRSYQYDPGANEFHAFGKNGDTVYVYGDVSPEDAEGFKQAPSKGQAWQVIQQNHPLVAKIINGKRIPITPSDPGFISSRWQPQL